MTLAHADEWTSSWLKENLLHVYQCVSVTRDNESKFVVSSGKIILLPIGAFAKVQLVPILQQRCVLHETICLHVDIDMWMALFNHCL